MYLTIKAILARNNHDITKAIQYCANIADTYPSLRHEYNAIITHLRLGNIQ